jgi:hypothetical protein
LCTANDDPTVIMAESLERSGMTGGGRAMTHAYVYQHGMRGYLEGIPLSGNPYNPAICIEAHEAWKDGWLDASRARGRLRALEIAARSHA